MTNTAFPVKPRFSKVIITLNKLAPDGDLILSDNTLSDVQTVMAKGGSVLELEVGDSVIIDIEKMMVPVKSEDNNAYEMQMQIKVDPIEIDGVTYAIIDDRLIKAVDNRK